MLKNWRKSAKSKVVEASNEVAYKTVMKGFTISDRSVASGGHAMLWRCYSAVKESTKEHVTVFLLNKKDLDEVVDASERDNLIERFKAGVIQQARILHPGALRVLEPMRQKGPYLMFATEQVFGSLANVVGDHTNVDVSGEKMKCFMQELDPLEKKYALFQLAEGLSFLHTKVAVAHLNLTPGNIWITPNGDWKIGGFEFSVPADGSRQPCQNFTSIVGSGPFDSSINPWLGPDLEYAAPEYVKGMPPSLKSDLFSFGCIAYEVLSIKERADPGCARDQLMRCGSNTSLYQSRLQELPSRLSQHPDQSASSTILELTHGLRGGGEMSAVLSSASMFSELSVKCLIYLPRLPEKSDSAKIAYLRDLYKVVEGYNNRIVRLKILPILLQLVHSNTQYVLPIVLQTVKVLERNEFEEVVLPHLSAIMTRNPTQQVCAIILAKTVDVVQKCGPDVVRSLFSQFVCQQLKTNASRGLFEVVKSLCQNGTFDNQIIDEQIIPGVCTIAAKHQDSTIRMCSYEVLVTIIPLMPSMSHGYIILQCMKQALTNEPDPALLPTVIKFYKELSNFPELDEHALAKSILTPLVSLLPGASDPSHFNAIYSVVTLLLARIQELKLEHFGGKKVTKQAPVPVEPQQGADWQTDLPLNVGKTPSTAVFGGLNMSGSGSSADIFNSTQQAPMQQLQQPLQQQHQQQQPQQQHQQQQQPPADAFGGLTGEIEKAKDNAHPNPWMRKTEGSQLPSEMCDPYKKKLPSPKPVQPPTTTVNANSEWGFSKTEPQNDSWPQDDDSSWGNFSPSNKNGAATGNNNTANNNNDNNNWGFPQQNASNPSASTTSTTTTLSNPPAAGMSNDWAFQSSAPAPPKPAGNVSVPVAQVNQTTVEKPANNDWAFQSNNPATGHNSNNNNSNNTAAADNWGFPSNAPTKPQADDWAAFRFVFFFIIRSDVLFVSSSPNKIPNSTPSQPAQPVKPTPASQQGANKLDDLFNF